ncbi:HAD-IA family hydrolase [Streptomyces sp. NPDC094032]|uniref:HAD family hydrolase n=1 Tax=Streptomyces sp. NPDC094032 TaxID=3155308 RepID=UPI00331A9ED7
MIKGVMFDFSGTLLRVESTAHWLDAVLSEVGVGLSGDEFAHTVERLTRYGALPGGPSPQEVPVRLRKLWDERDLDAERHRAAYSGLIQEAGVAEPELVRALYDRHMHPEAWHPYPDTARTLGELSRGGVLVAVVSNIGWDLRPVFRAHGLDEWIDLYALSYEVGVQKPDPAIFRFACDGLGLAPAETLMVGDDRTADGGARALGSRVHFVDHLPVDRRPDGLRPVFGLLGETGLD